jgi:hypothetical protein
LKPPVHRSRLPQVIENSLAGATGEASEFHPIPKIDV